MDYFNLLIKTVKEVEPYAIKMTASEYETHKQEAFKNAADTGCLSIYNFMVEVFELLDNKRKEAAAE